MHFMQNYIGQAKDPLLLPDQWERIAEKKALTVRQFERAPTLLWTGKRRPPYILFCIGAV
uniref:Uncharacterized protein n=1 Tax=Thermosporothrix sp. COM3 TaxID=2490863 RepID=A0A455SNK4_9CHLR|nr:hypothetical protein KTC_25460 [Thermosporothrix sp. COM3]